MTPGITPAGVAPFLPAVPVGPPHDPTWFYLNARTAWRTAAADHIDELSHLTLATPPGSFDSVLKPPTVAQGPDCSLFALDRENKVIKRYDPCCDSLDVVPCIGPFINPTAIAICSGNLFVCDPGDHRLSIYSLGGFVRRGTLQPPAPTHPWEPNAIDFDGGGVVYVADPANNRVHLFAPNGQWLRDIVFAGLPILVAIDCRDRLYVRLQGENIMHVLDPQGHETGTVAKPGQLECLFPCVPDLPASVAFPVPTPTFAPAGTWLAVLDSRLYRCQWHRIVIDADVPRGSRLLVSTYSTEADLPANQIPDLPESVWNTNQPVRTGPDWDCLVRSGGGRYLWVRLQFTGNGTVTPAVAGMRIEYPRISLRRYLPSVFSQDPSATDFTDRFLALFDSTFRSIESELDHQARYFDPASTPATAPRGRIDFLSWLGSWVGLKLDRGIPEDRRRALVEGAGRVAPIRGTPLGLHRQLLALLGMTPKVAGCCCGGPVCSCTPEPLNCRPAPPPACAWQPPPLILEHFQLRRWLYVGAGRLGDESVLWGERLVGRAHLDHDAQVGSSRLITTPDPYRDPFHYYAHKFTVFVPVRFGEDPGSKRALTNLLEAESPAHSRHYLQFVGPRFRIGFQSSIGLDSVVGRYPRGVELGATPLGAASVLDSPPNRQGGPTLQVGVSSRIGASTKLS
jgi:phage tail-like protein